MLAATTCVIDHEIHEFLIENTSARTILLIYIYHVDYQSISGRPNLGYILGFLS